MDQERLPRRILEWCPPGKRRKGRPGNSWMEEVTTGMRERGIADLEWVAREGWRKNLFILMYIEFGEVILGYGIAIFVAEVNIL